MTRLRTALLAAAVAIGALAAAFAIITAGEAKATPLSFIQSLNNHGFTVYDPAAALTHGYMVCAMLDNANGTQVAQYIFTHSSWSDIPDMNAADTWVIVSVQELCPYQDHSGGISQTHIA